MRADAVPNGDGARPARGHRCAPFIHSSAVPCSAAGVEARSAARVYAILAGGLAWSQLEKASLVDVDVRNTFFALLCWPRAASGAVMSALNRRVKRTSFTNQRQDAERFFANGGRVALANSRSIGASTGNQPYQVDELSALLALLAPFQPLRDP